MTTSRARRFFSIQSQYEWSDKMNSIKAALLICLAAPGAAHAGGAVVAAVEPVPTPPATVAAPAQDWTGLYLGIQATQYSGSASVIASGTEAFTFDGILGGIHAGYDHDFGRFVIGGEIAAETGGIGYDLAGTGAAAPFSLDRMVSLKLKAGLDLGRVLVYGSIGKARASVGDSSGLPGTDPGSADGTLYGLGISAMLSDRITAGLEVMSMDFDPYEGAVTLDSETTAISLRMSYRF